MRRFPATAQFAVAALLFFAACDSANDPQVPDTANFDAAVVAADGTLEDLRMMHGPRLGLPGAVFPPLPNESDCYASDGQFVCTPFERDGMTYSRTVTFLDINGDPQVDANGDPLYDEATTDGIRFQISVVGAFSRDRFSASVDRQRDLTVTGLLNDNDADDQNDDGVVTWVGLGSSDKTRTHLTDGGAARTYSVESSSVIEDVAMPYPRTEYSWPLSGTISRTMTMTRTFDSGESETITRDVIVTFDGTQFATVQVGAETYTVDLSERNFGPGKMRHRRGRRHGH